MKGLYRKNWSSEDVRQLFRLIDWIMDLPEDLEEAFRIDVHEYEEEKEMRYMTSIERLEFRDGKREGLQEGLDKGREEGLEKGLEKGRQGCLAAIAVALEAKFGQPGRQVLRQVRALGGVKELNQFTRVLKKAKTLDQVREYLEQ